MNRSLASRIAKLEPNAPKLPQPPNVLEVRHGETDAEAVARFRTRWPNVRAGHRFMVVPATMTPADFRIHSDARTAERRRAPGTFITAKEASP